MKKIGITGGIGSGKSTVSDYLTGKGFDVIDCDKIAREIMGPKYDVLNQLVDVFGGEILNPDDSLNREHTSQIVFADTYKRKILDNITHKAIGNVIYQRLEKPTSNPVFVDAALLFESDFAKEMDKIWIVTADMEIRKKRVVKRDNTDLESVEARIRAQMSDEEKIKLADEVIDNSGSMEDLYDKVEGLLRIYV